MVDVQKTQKSGFFRNDQFILDIVLCSEGGKRPSNSGISGPVRIAMAMAEALSVVLWPYLLSIASMMNGIATPVTPDEADRSPKAIPFRAIHHSFSMLTMGYDNMTNPTPYMT